MNEKNIMRKANHPFIVKLKFTFQNKIDLYYGMELVKGGVLMDYINK